MSIVISALHFDWPDIPGCFQRVKGELGLDGVELSWHESFERPHCTREDMEALRALKGQTGLILASHIWEDPARLGPGPAEEALLRWLELCGATGVSGLVVHGGSYDDQKQGIARTRTILQNVLPAFEKAGVTLNVENHYAYDYQNGHELFSQPWEFQEIFSLDSPALKFCFDTGHGHMTRNWRRLLGELGTRLNHVHLADNRGRDDDHLMFREGTAPWDDIFDELAEIGYEGTFCVEFPVREDMEPFHSCVLELHKYGW